MARTEVGDGQVRQSVEAWTPAWTGRSGAHRDLGEDC